MAQTIKELCQQIATAFELEGNESIEMYFDFIPDNIQSEEELKELMNFSGHSEFSSSNLKDYVESFALLLGSIMTFINLKKTLSKKKESVHAELIKNSWKNRLLAEGMEASKAEAIVSSFNEDLQTILNAE